MTNHTFDEFDNYRKERKAEMTLEEKLHKELDWLEIKHIDADGIIRNFLSICQQEIEDAKPKWISVNDRLPELGEKILVAIDGGWVILLGRLMTNGWTAFYSDGEELVNQDKNGSKVTHWMPLPESPKENT